MPRKASATRIARATGQIRRAIAISTVAASRACREWGRQCFHRGSLPGDAGRRTR